MSQRYTNPPETCDRCGAYPVVNAVCLHCGSANERREYRTMTAWDRDESEPCQRGTAGCSVDHHGNESCETW